MRRFATFIVISTLILINGCSKDTEEYTKYPVPVWLIESPELLPNSFTAIVTIPEKINVYATDSDMIAAFIDDECRGIGNLVIAPDKTRVYYITVRGKDSEDNEIVFKYYNSKLSYLYQATQTVPFVTDGTYGTNDSPVILDLKYL